MCCGRRSKPPYHPEDTLSALRPHAFWKALLWAGCPGGAGQWVPHRREMGKSFGNAKGPSWESCVFGAQVGKEDRRRRVSVSKHSAAPTSTGRSDSQARGTEMLVASAASCPHPRSKAGLMSKSFPS